MEMEEDEIFKLTSKDGNISVEKETVIGRRPSEAASRNRKMKGEPRTGEIWGNMAVPGSGECPGRCLRLALFGSNSADSGNIQ